MKSLKHYNQNDIDTGRAIAQGMRADKAQYEKNMARHEKRVGTMLERQAETALKGINSDGRERLMRPKN